MNNKNILKNLKDHIYNLLKEEPLIKEIINTLKSANAKAYLIGGATRDLLSNLILKKNEDHKLDLKDIDIEVHDITLEKLALVLKKFGPVDYIGKSFGVLKLHNLNVDWSLPRTDKSGRKPEVTIDPYMDIKEALRRRDLTINAIAIDLINMDVIDPFNGIADIKNNILRSPDINFFKEDPLRFYRVMQFISRFQMYPDDQLNNICKTMDINNISIERIEQEFKKLLLKSKYPSLGIRWLKDIDKLQRILPELYSTINTIQDPEWHPEGSVFEHLMQALDSSSSLTYDNHEEKLTIMLATLCHDLGKVTTTIFKDGHIRSPGHAMAGVLPTKNMLKRIVLNKKLIKTAAVLVKCHMRPGQLINSQATLSAYKRLAVDLSVESAGHANIKMLLKLAIADQRGRNPKSHIPLNIRVEWVDRFKEKVEKANIFHEPEKPILTGRDMQDIIEPGPQMGKILKFAYNIQLNQNIKDKDQLKKLVLQELKKESKSLIL